MKAAFLAFGRFVKSVFSESDGSGSFSRVAGFCVVIATIGWITHVVIHAHAVPDLTGASAFVTTGVGTLYGLNKAEAIIGAVKSTPTQNTPSS